MNADILGGVSIKDILKEIIPMDESPVFEVIKAADGAFELYRNYKREYAEIKNQIDSIPEEIRVLKNELLTFKRTEVDIYFQKRLETERYRLFARLDQLIVTPFVKKYEAINVDVPTNIFVGKTLVEIKGVLNSPLGSYSGENLIKSFYDHSATDGFTILKELIEDPELQVKPLAKFRKELDQFLYYLNDDFRNDFIGRIEDEMRIFERELPKVISDQLVEQFDNQISQIQQLKSFIIYVKNTISGYKALKLTDVQIDTLIQTAENILIAEFKDSASEIFNEAFALLGRPGSDIMTFENLFSVFKLEEARILKSYHSFQKSIGLDINRTKEDILQEINGKKEELATSIEKFKDFGKFKLKEIKNRLQRENTALIAAYNSGKGVLKAKEDVEKTIALLKKLQESQKQSFRYLWEIGPDNFRPLRTSVVSFYPTSKTEMTVDVKTDVNYKLSISKPPMYLGTEIQSYNQLSDFRLAFFDVLAIDFESIIFESGTKTSTDLDVNIRGVEFSGALNFVNAFQSFLDALEFLKNIAQGVITISYDIPIPNISAGAFNFLGGKIHAGVEIPIGSSDPMIVIFGVNSPGDLFLITYGIFGGRGCFQIGMNTRDGVFMVLLILEFGGVVLVNLGAAKGFIYLFAGIYYRKRHDTILIKGYLVAGGNLNIANLVTASITFTMALHGNGHYLNGVCSVVYTVKIGPFFEKSFRMKMEKRIAGAETKPSKKGQKHLENQIKSLNSVASLTLGQKKEKRSYERQLEEIKADWGKDEPISSGNRLDEDSWEQYLTLFHNL